MAQFKPRFARYVQWQDKAQPSYLARSASAQSCNWPDCPAKAVGQQGKPESYYFPPQLNNTDCEVETPGPTSLRAPEWLPMMR